MKSAFKIMKAVFQLSLFFCDSVVLLFSCYTINQCLILAFIFFKLFSSVKIVFIVLRVLQWLSNSQTTFLHFKNVNAACIGHTRLTKLLHATAVTLAFIYNM
jgi:hypothetical protein